METNMNLESGPQRESAVASVEEYRLRIFRNSLNLLAQVLIGIVVGACLLFSFRNGLPLNATSLHVVLCVIGYQLLMAQAILSMSSNNGWTANLKLSDKKLAHMVLQTVGSGLAIAGTIIKILDKEVHWDTLHGQFALVAFVFTSVSLVNGVASFWAYELRKCIPPKLSKLTHICFGIVGFAAANIALCYGLEKVLFVNWATSAMAYTIIGFVSCSTFIIILTPFINFVTKIKGN